MSAYEWTAELHERLVAAIEPKLLAPNGNPTLTAFDFASVGEIAQEIADAVESCWVPTEIPGMSDGTPCQMPLLVPVLSNPASQEAPKA